MLFKRIASTLLIMSTFTAETSGLRLVAPTIASSISSSTTSLQAVTSGTVADISVIQEAVSHFLPDADKCIFKPTSGGVNNVVQYVTTPSNPTTPSFICRIYNNGKNSPRVAFEHAVLNRLKDNSLPFKLPTFIPTLRDPSLTHVLLSTGAEACLCNIIPGALPKLANPLEIGRASGALAALMGSIDKIDVPCPTPPYYEIYDVHHAVNKESFIAAMQGPEFDGVRESANKLLQEVLEIEAKTQDLLKLDLPIQLIHGDLHYDNVLFNPSTGKVSGLLDFEFCSYDWRAMELAICLSKYAGEEKALQLFSDFVDGYSEFGKLTRKEVEAIPDLIILRVLSNVVYFVGRAIGAEDNISSLTTRAKTYATRVDWLKRSRQEIIDAIDAKMRSKY